MGRIPEDKRPVIAVDPDVDASGWAMIDRETRTVTFGKCPFPALVDKLTDLDARIYVEAGWLVGNSNYHDVSGRRGMRIAKNVGSNHQVGKLLIEMLEYRSRTVETIRPLRKCWRGPHGKITAEELDIIMECAGYPRIGRTNQDMRDAILLAWSVSNLPIIMKPCTRR